MHGVWCRLFFFFFFQAEDGIRDLTVTGVQTCALPISSRRWREAAAEYRRALSLADNVREQRFLTARLAVCEAGGGSTADRKRGGWGKRVELGGRRIIKKKKNNIQRKSTRIETTQ